MLSGLTQNKVDHSSVWRTLQRGGFDYGRTFAHVYLEKKPLYQMLLRHCPEHGIVLEVGCGAAMDSCYLATQRRSARFCAVDVSREALRIAEGANQHFGTAVQLVAANAGALCFPNATFDLVFSQGLIEHFPDPTALIAEQIRVLKPGAVLVIDVPQTYSLYTIHKRRQMARGAWAWGWESQYSYWDLKALAGRFDLQLLSITGWGYDRYTALLRWPLVKLERRRSAWARAAHHILSYALPRSLRRVAESAWVSVEGRLGPFFMQNITAVYRVPDVLRVAVGPAGKTFGGGRAK